MEANSRERYIRMPARKLRRVINEVRGKSVVDAVNMLKFMRISLGGSYRFSTDVSLTTYVNDNGTLTEEILAPDDIMNGWNVYLTFKFGKF